MDRWRIVKRAARATPYRLVFQGNEADARKRYVKLDVRQGGARLLAPGQPLETCMTVFTDGQSGPDVVTMPIQGDQNES